MIKGIGIDLVELDRIQTSLEKSDRLAKRVLTPKEQTIFYSYRSLNRKVEFLAGRFSAKEAFAKATGQGIGTLSFQDIEILADDKGRPMIKAKGYEADQIFVSITHSKKYAAAQVIIEEK